MDAIFQFPEWSLTESAIVYNSEKIPYSSIGYLKLGSGSLYLITGHRDYQLPFGPEDQERAEAAHAYILGQLNSAKNDSDTKAAVISEGTARVQELVRPTVEKSEGASTAKEKVLIQSPQFDAKKFFTGVLIVGAAFSIGILLLSWLLNMDSYYYDFGEALLICSILFCLIALVGGLMALWVKCYRLTVTDKRVYGTAPFGKLVELPVDSITAIAVFRFFRGISVSTPTGRITFFGVKNAEAIYRVISDLLIDRQQKCG